MEHSELLAFIADNWQVVFLYGVKYLRDFKTEFIQQLIKLNEGLTAHHDRILEIEIREKIRRESGSA